MTNVVPFDPAGQPAAFMPISLSATLRAALEPPKVVVFGEHGAEEKPAPWKLPAVTPQLRQEALAAVEAMKPRTAPAEQRHVDRWLAHLANLCAGKDLPPESKIRGISSQIIGRGYPAGIFTAETLDRVASKFVWWPGWAELSRALDAEADAMRVQWKHLVAIVKSGDGGAAGKSEDDRPPVATDEQKEAVRQMLLAAGIALKTPGAAAPAPAAPDGAA